MSEEPVEPPVTLDESSILSSVKKVLGLPDDYEAFDADVKMHINSVFSTLQQLGVGPEEGFRIEDKNSKWEDFSTDLAIDSVRSYVSIKVRLIFDPPSTSYTIEAMTKVANEFEWRLQVASEKPRD